VNTVRLASMGAKLQTYSFECARVLCSIQYCPYIVYYAIIHINHLITRSDGILMTDNLLLDDLGVDYAEHKNEYKDRVDILQIW